MSRGKPFLILLPPEPGPPTTGGTAISAGMELLMSSRLSARSVVSRCIEANRWALFARVRETKQVASCKRLRRIGSMICRNSGRKKQLRTLSFCQAGRAASFRTQGQCLLAPEGRRYGAISRRPTRRGVVSHVGCPIDCYVSQDE